MCVCGKPFGSINIIQTPRDTWGVKVTVCGGVCEGVKECKSIRNNEEKGEV